MAADVRQVMRILGYHGVTVALEGERIAATPRTRLSPELRHFIRHFRTLLIAHLASERQLAATVANLRRLTPAERARYRAELAAAPPGDPWLDHDRTAWRRAFPARTSTAPLTQEAA